MSCRATMGPTYHCKQRELGRSDFSELLLSNESYGRQLP